MPKMNQMHVCSLMSIDKGEVSALVLLDMSKAFDRSNSFLEGTFRRFFLLLKFS